MEIAARRELLAFDKSSDPGSQDANASEPAKQTEKPEPVAIAKTDSDTAVK